MIRRAPESASRDPAQDLTASKSGLEQSPLFPDDDLARTKTRLAHAESAITFDFVREYPKGAVTLAFVAGFVCARFPFARRALTSAAIYTLRNALPILLKHPRR